MVLELYAHVVPALIYYTELAFDDGLSFVLLCEFAVGAADTLLNLEEAARLHMCFLGDVGLLDYFTSRKADRQNRMYRRVLLE